MIRDKLQKKIGEPIAQANILAIAAIMIASIALIVAIGKAKA